MAIIYSSRLSAAVLSDLLFIFISLRMAIIYSSRLSAAMLCQISYLYLFHCLSPLGYLAAERRLEYIMAVVAVVALPILWYTTGTAYLMVHYFTIRSVQFLSGIL